MGCTNPSFNPRLTGTNSSFNPVNLYIVCYVTLPLWTRVNNFVVLFKCCESEFTWQHLHYMQLLRGGGSELSNIFILPSKLIILWLLFKVIESQMKSWTLGFLSNSNKIRSFHQNSYLAPIFWGIIFWVAWILPDVITT